MESENRSKIFDLFQNGEAKVLITTNLLSRSIDVPNVKVVVNFDAPKNVRTGWFDSKTYVHRIGRTGRLGNLEIIFNIA